MISKVKRTVILSALSAMIFWGLGACESTLFAQGTPVVPTAGDTGQQAQTFGPADRTTTTTETGRGVGELGNAIELDTDLEPIEDTRNQGYVGVTGSRIQNFGFVGRPGALTAPQLATGAFIAGGVNGASNSSVNIGGGGNAGGGAAGFGAASNGVTITRRSMRSRVRPSFSAPKLSSQQVSSRFNDHFVLQPGSQAQGVSYSVNVQDRTAVLNGSVNTQAQSERLVRQLRLEPGVYKVVNRLQILN